jgi:hypothetical protein
MFVRPVGAFLDPGECVLRRPPCSESEICLPTKWVYRLAAQRTRAGTLRRPTVNARPWPRVYGSAVYSQRHFLVALLRVF